MLKVAVRGQAGVGRPQNSALIRPTLGHSPLLRRSLVPTCAAISERCGAPTTPSPHDPLKSTPAKHTLHSGLAATAAALGPVLIGMAVVLALPMGGSRLRAPAPTPLSCSTQTPRGPFSGSSAFASLSSTTQRRAHSGAKKLTYEAAQVRATPSTPPFIPPALHNTLD